MLATKKGGFKGFIAKQPIGEKSPLDSSIKSHKKNGVKFSDYLKKEKEKDPQFKKYFEEGYEEFKLEVIGELIKEERKRKKLTQETLARRLHTKKSAISRIERHASDVKLSTLGKVSRALGKRLEVRFV